MAEGSPAAVVVSALLSSSMNVRFYLYTTLLQLSTAARAEEGVAALLSMADAADEQSRSGAPSPSRSPLAALLEVFFPARTTSSLVKLLCPGTTTCVLEPLL